MSVTKNDSETTELSSSGYAFNINTSLSTQLPSINSRTNISTSYSNTINSDDTQRQNYSFALGLNSRIFNTISNNVNLSYTQYESSYTTLEAGKKTSSSISTNMSDSLSFPSIRLGIRGAVNYNAGVSATSTINNGVTSSVMSYNAAASIRYRFFTKLMFTSNINVSQTTNVTTYSGSANLNFRAGKTSFLMGYRYNNSETVDTINPTSSERSSIMVKLTRSF